MSTKGWPDPYILSPKLPKKCIFLSVLNFWGFVAIWFHLILYNRARLNISETGLSHRRAYYLFCASVLDAAETLGISGFLIETKKSIFTISSSNIVSSVQKSSITQQKLSLVVPPLCFEGIAVQCPLVPMLFPSSGSLAGLHSQKTPCHPLSCLDHLPLAMSLHEVSFLLPPRICFTHLCCQSQTWLVILMPPILGASKLPPSLLAADAQCLTHLGLSDHINPVLQRLEKCAGRTLHSQQVHEVENWSLEVRTL